MPSSRTAAPSPATWCAQILDEETAKIREEVGEEVWQAGRPDDTREIFERVALADELVEFFTLAAYEYLD